MVRPATPVLNGGNFPESHLNPANGANCNLQNHDPHTFVSTPDTRKCQTPVSKLPARLVPVEHPKYLKCNESRMELITFLPAVSVNLSV